MAQDTTNLTISLIKKPTNTYPQTDDIFKISHLKSPQESDLKDDQVLVRLLYVSIDASMRVWISGIKTYRDPVNPGDIMPSGGLCEILASKSKKFQKGDYAQGWVFWQNTSVLDAKGLTKIPKEYPNPQHFLGVLGVSGLTAYFGLFEIGKPQKGETVVISAAAGAVGEIAVQLAKQHGCKVIAIAGSKEKCEYIVKVLKADACINYKTESVQKRLKELSPEGIDVYFDNVGGQMLDDVLMNITDFSRVIMCGAISGYNNQSYGVKNYMRLITKKASMQGFIVMDFYKQYPQAVQFLANLVQQKKLIFKEHILQGLDLAPKGLQQLLLGQNEGKVLIQNTTSNNNSIKPKL